MKTTEILALATLSLGFLSTIQATAVEDINIRISNHTKDPVYVYATYPMFHHKGTEPIGTKLYPQETTEIEGGIISLDIERKPFGSKSKAGSAVEKEKKA